MLHLLCLLMNFAMERRLFILREHIEGLKKDPFIQESPYYQKEWKELLQKPQREPILIASTSGFSLESGILRQEINSVLIGTSIAINNYVFVRNTPSLI